MISTVTKDHMIGPSRLGCNTFPSQEGTTLHSSCKECADQVPTMQDHGKGLEVLKCSTGFLKTYDVGFVAKVLNPQVFVLASSLGSEDRSEKPCRIPRGAPMCLPQL